MSKRLLAKWSFAAVTFLFTAFVFVNTYEVVFNRDVAFAQSIRKMSAQSAMASTVSNFQTKLESDSQAGMAPLEHIDSLEVPALEMQVTIEESRRIGNDWYQRPSAAHYVGLNKDRSGVSIDYLIYTSKSWRTISNPAQIEQGMEVKIAHDNGTALFTVAEKKVLSLDHSLLVGKTEDRQVLLLVEDPENNLYYGYSLVPQR